MPAPPTAAWTVKPPNTRHGDGDVTYTIEFSCSLWDDYRPTAEECTRHVFAVGQVIHVGPRQTDADGGPTFAVERYFPYRLGGDFQEDRNTDRIADFVLIDSPADFGSVTGSVVYPDDATPRYGVDLVLEDR